MNNNITTSKYREIQTLEEAMLWLGKTIKYYDTNNKTKFVEIVTDINVSDENKIEINGFSTIQLLKVASDENDNPVGVKVNKTKNIFGFIGYSGSGKDYTAKLICDSVNCVRINMSDVVKEIVYSQLNINENDLDYETLKQTSFWLPNGNFTGRNLMNGLTETIIKYDPEFWFKIWQKKVLECDFDNIVVTDIRYFPSLKYLFHSDFNTTITFTNYVSDRYKRQDGKTEELVDKIIANNENIKHLADITEYIKGLL